MSFVWSLLPENKWFGIHSLPKQNSDYFDSSQIYSVNTAFNTEYLICFQSLFKMCLMFYKLYQK